MLTPSYPSSSLSPTVAHALAPRRARGGNEEEDDDDDDDDEGVDDKSHTCKSGHACMLCSLDAVDLVALQGKSFFHEIGFPPRNANVQQQQQQQPRIPDLARKGREGDDEGQYSAAPVDATGPRPAWPSSENGHLSRFRSAVAVELLKGLDEHRNQFAPTDMMVCVPSVAIATVPALRAH
ncbi:hypothetical protein AXG93_509s1090 [Marchantia polymorpha subsp. ruderalis]|uniref:Uncharacterized protein n=1 Tax=Marchantia polymorpha subsp. ruderalis TaxID=1480154 RepID=A0A176W9A4_MARPO|nr:hypothetical protein AXG93_509s1090 [Marchantia polymorpha subsp. ruderalis]